MPNTKLENTPKPSTESSKKTSTKSASPSNSKLAKLPNTPAKKILTSVEKSKQKEVNFTFKIEFNLSRIQIDQLIEHYRDCNEMKMLVRKGNLEELFSDIIQVSDIAKITCQSK